MTNLAISACDKCCLLAWRPSARRTIDASRTALLASLSDPVGSLKLVYRKYRLTPWAKWTLILEFEWVMVTTIRLYSALIDNDFLQHLYKCIQCEEYQAGVRWLRRG
jgi:hypothetical protein